MIRQRYDFVSQKLNENKIPTGPQLADFVQKLVAEVWAVAPGHTKELLRPGFNSIGWNADSNRASSPAPPTAQAVAGFLSKALEKMSPAKPPPPAADKTILEIMKEKVVCDQEAVRAQKQITLGDGLSALIRELVTKRQWFPSPTNIGQKKTKKWATGDTLVSLAANIPRFLQECMIDRLSSYTDEKFREYVETPRGSGEWRLASHSYRLLISVFERDFSANKWRFPRGDLTLAIIKEHFHTPICAEDAFRAVLSLVIMTHVSYATIAAGTHPADKTPDWDALYRHVARDVRFCGRILESTERPPTTALSNEEYEASRAILAFLLSSEESLRLPAQAHVGTELLKMRYAESGVPQGACKLCTEDILNEKRPEKTMLEILKKCPDGVYHEQLKDHCSYVCILCNVPGHHITSCEKNKSPPFK